MRSRITHGDLTPGDKPPSQRVLADHYGAARATVQSVMASLGGRQIRQTGRNGEL